MVSKVCVNVGTAYTMMTVMTTTATTTTNAGYVSDVMVFARIFDFLEKYSESLEKETSSEPDSSPARMVSTKVAGSVLLRISKPEARLYPAATSAATLFKSSLSALLSACSATSSTVRTIGMPEARMIENCWQMSASSLPLILRFVGSPSSTPSFTSLRLSTLAQFSRRRMTASSLSCASITPRISTPEWEIALYLNVVIPSPS
jgi:hypothetical protein